MRAQLNILLDGFGGFGGGVGEGTVAMGGVGAFAGTYVVPSFSSSLLLVGSDSRVISVTGGTCLIELVFFKILFGGAAITSGGGGAGVGRIGGGTGLEELLFHTSPLGVVGAFDDLGACCEGFVCLGVGDLGCVCGGACCGGYICCCG